MSGEALALVLSAAVIHAAWNALAKRARDQFIFLWWAVSGATVVLLPVALWTAGATGVSRAAMPFLIGTILVHGLYFYALARSYGAGDFSLVYPMARGLGVALVPVLALGLFQEALSPLGTLGVALVVTGIV